MLKFAAVALAFALTVGSTFAVLHVNDALLTPGELLQDRKRSFPPHLDVEFYDHCNILIGAQAAVNLVQEVVEITFTVPSDAFEDCSRPPVLDVQLPGSGVTKTTELITADWPWFRYGNAPMQGVKEIELPNDIWDAGFGTRRVSAEMFIEAPCAADQDCKQRAGTQIIYDSRSTEITDIVPFSCELGEGGGVILTCPGRPTLPTTISGGVLSRMHVTVVDSRKEFVAQSVTIIGSSIVGAIISIFVGVLVGFGAKSREGFVEREATKSDVLSSTSATGDSAADQLSHRKGVWEIEDELISTPGSDDSAPDEIQDHESDSGDIGHPSRKD